MKEIRLQFPFHATGKFRLIATCFLLVAHIANAIVKYDEGRIEVDGIQLFQDSENGNAYYYLPPYPRLSISKDGDFEFLCAKYVGTEGRESSGGLFHALVQFSLTKEEVIELEGKLKEKFPKAVIMGPVPMLENEDGNAPGFRIVSTILDTTSAAGFSSSTITSGKAPFLPGSKAAIAAHLEPDGATLLWESFQGATSDVSVVVEGYFRAKLKAYHATVNANLEIAYDHFSSFDNVQSGFTRDQATEILDSLCQSGAIDIDVADMSAGLDVSTEAYQNILTIITNKVVELMFDVNAGWAKLPESEAPAQPTDLKERYQRGAFVRFFVGDGTQQYIPDDQLVLKKKTEIRNFHFFLNLNQSTVIKVPVYSAGNIRGFYREFGDDKKYFRVVDMNDPAFQSREIHFQIDGNFIGSFGDVIDQAWVLVEKEYPEDKGDVYTGSLVFNKTRIDSGEIIQTLNYHRLGDLSETWKQFRYKVGWKFIGIDSVITVPDSGWVTSSHSSISIEPPVEKSEIEIAVDRKLLEESKIQSVRIRFASILFQQPHKGEMVVVRANEADEKVSASVYRDKGEPVVYQVNWYTTNATVQDELKILDDDYLFLVPPSPAK